MIGTGVGVILGALLYLAMAGDKIHLDAHFIGYLMAAIGVASLLVLAHILSMTWPVLLQAEQYLTPRISELAKKDGYRRFIIFVIIIFSLISIVFSLDALVLNTLSKNVLIPVWVAFLGLAIDAVYLYSRQISNYLNPFEVTKLFFKEAEKSIQNDRELDMCDWIDAFSDVSNKAIDRNNIALCNQSLDDMLQTIRLYLEASTSLAHANIEGQAKEKGISDRVSYSLFFLLHRYEMINENAAVKRLEPVSSHVMTNTGKVVLAAAKCDMSLSPHPLLFLGRFALTDIKHKITEAGPKAICILVGVAKSLLTDIDVRFLELQATFFSLIDQMKMISQEMFKQDKTISIKILIQPFHDLKTFFATEKMASHPDTPAILQQIDRVLQEFAALEAVLRTMPPIPKVSGVEAAEKLSKGL